MSTFLIVLISLIAGWKLREYTAVRKINKMMQTAEETKQEVNKVNVKIERKNDIFYLYNMDNDEFLTQGKTKEEIQANLKQRFGNVNMAFHATPDNIKEVGFK